MIPHPFVGDLSELSLEELQTKIGELTKHMNWAYRMQNSALIYQLQMTYTAYQNAYAVKLDESMSKKNLGSQIKVDQ